MDKSYRTETFTNGAGDVSGDSVLIFENSSRQQWNPVIAAFLHAGWDIGSAIKPAACIGLSINTATLDLTTVLVGGSLMLGRSDRFVLSGGWAFKKVNVLSGKFEAGKAYPKTDVGSSVPLENVFRSGGFVSLSYNLTNKPVQK
jgi:hypothetical protein